VAPRCIPEQPFFRSGAERRVWEALRKKLRPADVLLANVPFVSKDGSWEVDLIVLIPEVGFAAIEVKGGYVRRADGEWRQQTPEGDKVIDLDEQAKSGRYLVERYLKEHWRFGKPRMAHFAALPDTGLGPEDPSPGLPRNRVLAKGDLADAAGRLHDVLRGTLANEPNRAPGQDAVDAAAAVLGGVADPGRDRLEGERLLAAYADELTRTQYALLDFVRTVPRYEVVGGPGSGKTYLALEQARRWAEGGARVAYVCYSHGLAAWANRWLAEQPEAASRRIEAMTYHSLGHRWGEPVPDGAGQSYWEDVLPARMLELARGLPSAERFDALVVDEAQDFSDPWWPSLLAALADPGNAPIAVFGDDGQRVFDRTGRPGVDLVPLALSRNLRNTRQIASLIAPFAGERAESLGGVGPEVRFVPCPQGEAVHTADDAVDALLADGWEPRQVALLTTHHRHPMQVDQVERLGTDGYWASLWDDEQAFYGTVLGFKGLERPVVALAVDGFLDPARAREVLYVGMSRATHLLVVCGDLAEIRAAAGKEVAKRLARGTVTDPSS
jgi:hypothetical protein